MRHSLSRNTEGVFRFRHLSGRTLRAAIALVLCTAMLFSAAGCSDTPEEESSSSLPESQVSSVSQEAPPPPPVPVPEQRAYRTQLKGGGEDVVTVMMYFCGSDLESRGGAATLDLIEMMSADIGENVNVVVETGGSLKWATEVMDPTKNERWQVVKEDLLPLDSIEAANMSEPATLQNFITYSAEKFPADRYMLVLWDHGGGTVGGYAYDERYEDNSLMSIADLDEALEGAGVDFDMIGFDCCLMGTAETAFVAEKHADYMVASQRVEPGNGWEYTTWLTALSGNTSISTTDLGKIIVDGFVEHNAEGYYGSELTLSVLDLTHIPGLFGTMGDFFADVKPAMVSDGMFVSTSKMLGENRAMQKDHDLVDISVLAENMPGHEGLIKQLDDCVVYNGSTIDGYNGLCMYIPYRNLYQVEEALTLYEQVGIGEQYQDFVGSFANLLLGGQMRNSDGTVGLDDPTDDLSLAYLARSSWADESAWDSMSGFFDSTRFNGDALAIETVTARYDDDAIGSFESYAVPMTPEQWDLITDIRSCKTIEVPEAGEYGGYFELGYDIEWVRDDDGNLLVFSVAACNALDGHIAPYYTEAYQTFGAEVEDEWFADDWYSYGYVS